MTSAGVDLIVSDLTVHYDGVVAVERLSCEVGHGDIVAMLGANGAGKSSTLAALSGSCVGSTSGEIAVFGQTVRRPRAHRMARMGVVLVPEGRHVFAPLSVEENLLLGGYLLKSRARSRELLSEIYDLFPVLAERRISPAGLLSGGEQQMLAFGRAMMSEPKLILMDEPSMGLAPVMVDRVMAAVQTINRTGTSILLVEQNAVAALGVARYGYILDRGRLVKSGPAGDLARDPAVDEAFLGLGAEATEGAVGGRSRSEGQQPET